MIKIRTRGQPGSTDSVVAEYYYLMYARVFITVNEFRFCMNNLLPLYSLSSVYYLIENSYSFIFPRYKLPYKNNVIPIYNITRGIVQQLPISCNHAAKSKCFLGRRVSTIIRKIMTNDIVIRPSGAMSGPRSLRMTFEYSFYSGRVSVRER